MNRRRQTLNLILHSLPALVALSCAPLAHADFTYTVSWTVADLKANINNPINSASLNTFCGTPSAHTTNCGFFDLYTRPDSLTAAQYDIISVSAPSSWTAQVVTSTLSGLHSGNFAEFIFNPAGTGGTAPPNNGTNVDFLTDNPNTVGKTYDIGYPASACAGGCERSLTGDTPLANSDVFSVTIKTTTAVTDLTYWDWLGSYVRLSSDGTQKSMSKFVVDGAFVTPEPSFLAGTAILFALCLILARHRASRRAA